MGRRPSDRCPNFQSRCRLRLGSRRQLSVQSCRFPSLRPDVGPVAGLERRYLEDFDVGQVFESTEEYEITPDNLREYASEYDPQAIHLDPQVAEREMFGGVVAS